MDELAREEKLDDMEERTRYLYTKMMREHDDNDHFLGEYGRALARSIFSVVLDELEKK